ncbi:MAG TPA: MATE family efflux transporter, partial [Phaeodactylibacter sp.]|nr:MATE family efflux transporter [Phaeodactylibacter sp.]
MRLQTTYREILRLSLPLMVGSAVQNIIALSDSVFLYHLSEEDFAVIGLISAFYLVVAAIGYGFSKGGQIIIARRIGEQRWGEVGRSFYSMLFFELFLALVLFGLMQWGVPQMLHSIVSSEVIYE